MVNEASPHETTARSATQTNARERFRGTCTLVGHNLGPQLGGSTPHNYSNYFVKNAQKLEELLEAWQK